jgi:hypothetical protein
MPTYEISAPDGSKYQIEGPEGATQDQVIREVLRQNPLAGQTTEELKKAPSAPFSFGDIARSGGTGVVSGLGALTAVGGASSTPTKYLDEKTQALQSGLSPQRLAEMQRREEIIKRAEESGSTWEKIKAGAGAVAEAPLQSLAQGLGSAVTPAAAAVAAVVAAPASIAAGVGIAAAGFVGLLMGAGGSKQEINERVRREFEKAGDPPDVAARKADEAQSWTGENLDQIMINAGAGALEGATGVGRVAAGAARSARGLKALPTKPLTAPTKIGTVAGSALEEAAPELIQSLAGTAAGNIAATRAGFQTDTFEGATSAATRDALIGALTGAAVSPVQYKSLQGDFLRQQNEEATKKQEEFQKQREEFAQKYQQQQEETKKNLGLNMLALPAPAATVEEKYRNPAATITREELGEQEVNGKKIKSEALQYLDDYRKANNLPALKAYSIEDIQDAMPGLNPEGEKGIIEKILAGKYGYEPVDKTTGNEIKYTSDDIMALAEEEKNIATGTQGFKDFLTSVTGTDNVGEMSQPQLHAAYSALQKFEPSEETRILPQGTAATRFSEKQYDKALKWVGITFGEFDNKPLDPDEIVKDIKDATGLENDRDARALLDSAVKNGDLTLTTKPVFRVVDPATGQFVHTAATRAKAEKFASGKDLNIIGDSQSYISPAEQAALPDRTPLPAGYQIKQERVVEGEQDLVDVMREGKGQPLDTIAVDKAQERIDTLTGESKTLADRALKRIEQDSATTQKIQKNLDQRIAKGEGKTRDFEIQKSRSEKTITNLRKRIQKNLDKIEELSAPIKTRKSEVKKPIIKKKLTVTKDGKAIGTFSQDEIGKANAQAQDAILTQMTDEELQAAIDDKKLGIFREKAKKEQDRRRGPTGFKITKAKTPETLSPEFVDQAEEIKKRLMPTLQKFGLGNVGLNIVNAIKNNAEGSYLNSLIQVAIDAEKPVQTMRHEALHALKDLGFFSDSQWQALTNKAKTEWINKYLKSQNSEFEGEVMSRYDAYKKMGLSDESIAEEAIADAFGDFDANGSPAGMVAAILKRLNQFFEALRNAITGAGFQTAEDIFGKVERGELKGTKEATAEEKASLRIPLSTRAIMEQNDAFAQNELGLTNNPVFLTYDPKTGQVVSAHKKLETAQARAKKENLKVKQGFENNVRDVAIALNNETRTQHGAMNQKTLGTADSDALSRAMADEVGYQLRAMSKTGTGQGWYSNNYPNAVKRLAKRFPELGTNKHARSVFSALVAITSNGEDVSTNIGNAIHYYSILRMGKPLVALGSRRANALENNLQQLEDLLKTYGTDFEKILMEEITVKDMNAYLRSIGEKTSSDYLATTVIPKAAIYFGPKLGAFYANLSGSEGYLTMDLWWTRTMNRMRGLLLPEATQSSIDSFREMIGEPNASKEKIVELTIPLRNKYEEFGWNTELEHLVGAKEPSTNVDKPKWNRKAKKLAGDAYEQLMFDHKLEKMANTIYKNEFETLEEAPFSPSDRKFMYDAARKTQSLLRKEGINLSLADIQAALWYYEKRLYAKLKGGKPDDIGYEEAIIENANKVSGRERPSVVFPEQPNGGDVSQAKVADSDAIGGSSASGEEKYSLRGIIAEVAPHPDQEVVNRWREMTPSERLAATTNVANKTMRRIFDELGFTGYTYKFSTGKYEGEQNPNILVEAPDDASTQDLNKLARVMGFVFDQKAMIAYDESNTTSDDQGSFVKVIVPEGMSPTDLNKLRDLIGTTVPQAEGDTLRDGALIFGNFSAFNDNIETLDDKQFRRAIANAVELFDYDGIIQVSEPETFHSQYVWPDNRDGYLEGTEYGNGRDIQSEEGADVRGGGRSRLQTIADEAISLRDRWIDSRGAARIGSGTKFDKVAIPEPTAEYGEPTEGSVSAVGVHFSKQPRSTLVSSMYGTGLKGAEFERLIDAPDIRPRIYFYVDKGNGIRPEAGVGGSPHVIRLNNLYDASSDSKGIIKNNTGTTLGERLNNLERSIIEAGYDGYLSKDPLLSQGFAVLVGKHNIETKVKLSLRSTRQPPESKEFKQWFGNSYFTSGGEPLIMYHGTARDITIFKGKQAKAIFVTTEPKVAETYADMGVDYMRTEAYKALTRDEKVELITVVAERAMMDGTITKAELKEIQSNLKKRVPPIDSEKNRIIDLPYQIEGEIIESLNNLLPTKGNIMPVYVNARNVFDYANKDHVNQVYNWMMNNSRALGRMQNPEDWLKSVKGQISRGNWIRIESEDVQEAIRALDFDGFSVLEAGSKNYAVYNATNIKSVTGNIGTFGLGEVTAEQAKQFGMTADQAKQAQEEGDIRFSLKNIGYHSGDLGYGADTVLGRMAGSRSTGHFGTGVYFVGKPISREGRPTKIANLSQYNLFKPSFPSSAEGVHNALKLVNRAVGRDLSDEDQRSQYDNDIDEAAMYLDILLRTSFTRPEIKKVIESSVAEARKERTPKIIHTDTYIDSASTRVMKKLGFDGVDVRGLEGFDNTEYGTVVYRESVPEAKEKLSLKKTLPANIAASIEKTTTVREEKGFAERMMEAISPKGFSSWRAEAVNRYNALSIADKIKVQKRGGVKLYADQSAEAAALMSDNAAGVAASAMGVHDRRGGIPVFKNGVTTIDGSVEGIVSIFAPLAKYKDPFVYQMYQFYSGAKRARRYLDKGIEKNYDANDIAYAEQLGKDYPEFKQIFEKWDKYNKGLVKYQVDTGVLSPAEGAEYIKYADYVPFYRQLEGEKTFGPNVFQSISGVKKPKKYTGGEAPIADFMETIVRNTQSAIQAGMKNTAAKMAVDTFVEIDQAELAPDGSTGEEYVHVLEGGVKKSYLVYDKALVQSVMSLNLPELPFIGFFAGPANLLRNLVTKDPGFMLANMVRDSMSAWVTSGVKMTPVASAIKNFTGALRGTAPEYQALLNAGILGGYDYSQGVEVSAASMKKALGKYAPSTSLDKLKNVPTSLWESLEKGTMASDAATRMEVYKSVLAETGNEAEALYRAMEVMNFNRKGRSAVVRVLTAAVPFLNARIQGLDVLYRAMSGQMGTSDAKKIQKAFFVRGASIMAMSMIYWALTHDEEEYKKQEQETRDNYWLIPSMGIKIPIPFEVGVIFKVIPERIAEYFLGNDTGKDFADSMKRNFMNTFAFNLIPQTVLPIYEAKTNYSFFTQRNIIGAGLEGVAPEYQVGPSTSQLAAFLGKELGYSPMLIDHVIGGYTGTFGSYAVDVIDAIAFAGADVQRPSKRFEQLPIFKRFLLDPQAKGNVTAYYDLKNSVDEAVRTSNFLEKTSNFEELGKYNEETLKVLASKDFISDMEKDMKELREMSTFVRSSTMSPDDKRDMLMSITDAENAMTANVRYLRKLMD